MNLVDWRTSLTSIQVCADQLVGSLEGLLDNRQLSPGENDELVQCIDILKRISQEANDAQLQTPNVQIITRRKNQNNLGAN